MRNLMMAATVIGALGGTMGGSQAADMPVLRGSYSDGIGLRPIWEGFYIGGQGSQAWLNTKDKGNYNADIQNAYAVRTGLAPSQLFGPSSVQGRSAAYGGFIGYNSQWDDVVVGIEANYLHSDVNTTATLATLPTSPIQGQSTLNVALKDFGSLRARGGYMIGGFLPYAFVGFAAGSVDVSRSAGVTSNNGVPVTFPFETAQRNLFAYGFSAGVGIDVLLVGGLFARAEYEYMQFSSNLNASINTVKVGVGYKF